ncbi:MAG TPA: 1-phosphofructokinase family hexose kinase [Candidatus Acetothermia bacterium]|nr:1-phosphofructokinase family hexose kinase [Candidatus Acetothermia bacterium]HEX32724.1 1-phosphofructokinase family hexose kinase [Candidatus Acetothermia bacterium]
MIITVTPNPAVDKIYWVDQLKMARETQDEFLTRARRSDTSAGGKGVNMSIFLSRLGVENVAMGFVGGHVGHVVVRDLRDEGVTTNFVWVNGETRTNVIVLERGHEYVPIMINEPGPAISTEEVARFLRRYKRMLNRATWVILAGSLPPGVDGDMYRVLASMAREAGARVVISAERDALARGLLAAPYIIKPDIRVTPVVDNHPIRTRSEIIDAGKKIVADGTGIVIVSHEVTGDIAITADGVWEIHAPAKTTEFKNFVGADDVLLAGIVHMLNKGERLEDALRFGMAAGMISAESEAKICSDIDRIEKHMETISINKL